MFPDRPLSVQASIIKNRSQAPVNGVSYLLTPLRRAQSLVESEALIIRICKIAAQSQGFSPEGIHGFIEMVPMGDAEIIRLQYEEDHAYMQ